jgi:hypothetical protein
MEDNGVTGMLFFRLNPVPPPPVGPLETLKADAAPLPAEA